MKTEYLYDKKNNNLLLWMSLLCSVSDIVDNTVTIRRATFCQKKIRLPETHVATEFSIRLPLLVKLLNFVVESSEVGRNTNSHTSRAIVVADFVVESSEVGRNTNSQTSRAIVVAENTHL
jgi:hypothetical protein